MRVIVILRSAVTLTLLALSAAASDQARPDAAAQPPARRLAVSFKDGRLGVDLQDQRLESVVDEIARRARIVVVSEGLADRRVSARFQDLPLDEGLKEILTGCDVFFFYATGQSPRPGLKAVWAYPAGRGQGLQPVPPESWASTREMERRLSDADAQVRARAVETLVEREDRGALDAVVKALADADDGVRTRALYGAFSHGLELPPESLAQALQDSSPEVRFLALESAAGAQGGRKLIESALKDPDPRIQHRAREILTPPNPSAGRPSPQQKTR